MGDEFEVVLNETKRIEDANMEIQPIHLHHISPFEAFCGSYCYEIGFAVKIENQKNENFYGDVFLDSSTNNYIEVFDYKIIILEVIDSKSAKIKVEKN